MAAAIQKTVKATVVQERMNKIVNKLVPFVFGGMLVFAAGTWYGRRHLDPIKPGASSSDGPLTTNALLVGIRMTIDNGPSFFGIEEANTRLRGGDNITSIQEGGVLMKKTGEDGTNVHMYYSGGSIRLNFQPIQTNTVEAAQP